MIAWLPIGRDDDLVLQVDGDEGGSGVLQWNAVPLEMRGETRADEVRGGAEKGQALLLRCMLRCNGEITVAREGVRRRGAAIGIRGARERCSVRPN